MAKRLLTIVVLGLIPLVAGFATGSEESASAGAGGDEPYEFTVLVNYDWFAPNGPWGEDLISQELSQMFNIDINWTGSGGNPDQKIATLLVSGDLPESIILDRTANYLRLIDLEKLVPLDDWIDEYSGYRSNVSDSTINLSRVDGNVWGILNWPTDQPNGNGGWAINKVVHRELGEPAITTLDDLYDYLVDVRDSGITTDAGAEIVPIQFGQNLDFTQVYVAHGDGRILNYWDQFAWVNPSTGSFEFIGNDPAFVDTMLYLQRLYSEGLMNRDIFVEQTDQIKEKAANGRFGVTAARDLAGDPLRGMLPWREEEDVVYNELFDVLLPISVTGNHEDVWSNTYNALGWNIQTITTSAEQPERIYEYYDFISSNEGQIMIQYGPQGNFWDELDANGYPVWNEAGINRDSEASNATGLWFWTWPGMTGFTDSAKVVAEYEKPFDKRDVGTMWQHEVLWRHSFNATEFNGSNPAGDTAAGIARQATEDLFKEFVVKIISADSQAESRALISELIENVDEVGFDATLDFYNEVWAANRANL